jgi:hypothetical protein
MGKIYLALIALFCTFSTFSQITTSSILGKVSENGGEGIPGATVMAVHTPSGTKYGTVTSEDGRYRLVNLRVGGPYVIRVTFIGYGDQETNNVFLRLGESQTYNFGVQENTTTLNEVEVLADDVINRTRTGAATAIDSEKLRSLPTITRSTADYVRLNPMAAEGGSFAGRNDQFNNYSLDGAIFNNPFGLDASTPGGQTDAQPVSLDAIEQISVQIAPYDVTQSGFTGASINAVTKSGTNKFKGTVFGFYRNQNLVGNKVNDVSLPKLNLSQTQFGFSLGGPIIKNKLFFFVNAEFDRRSDIGSPFIPAGAGRNGENVSRVEATDLASISSLLRNTFDYETGPYEGFEFKTNNQKGIAKIDWNINQNHSFSLTYNFLDAFKEKPAHPSALGRRGPDFLTLQYRNSGYRINNGIQGAVAEVRSRFGNNASNKFQVGITSFKDSRNPFSEPFPVLNINKGGVPYIIAGHEPFSVNNVLDQNVFQISDNFTLFKGAHTFTFGSSLERFDFNNSFNLTAYGSRIFFPGVDINDIGDFITSPGFANEVEFARQAYATNSTNNSWALAETTLGQWAIYAQDEFVINDNFSLSYGLRIDTPLYFDTSKKIQENIDRKGGTEGTYQPQNTYYDEFGKAVQFDHTVLPKQTPLFSPRIGFNYDITGKQNRQLRGGSGIFTGRLPFVWIGNQVANPDFFFYCITDPNFKFPQVWRTNLGYDHKFGNGWLFSGDFIYTKDLNAQMVRNYGLKLPSGTLNGADSRPIYLNSDRATNAFGGVTNAYVFTNTNVGYTVNATAQIEKNFASGGYFKFAYNFLDAKDASSIDAEISSDAYDRNPANISHTNTALLAPSLYGNRHRFMVVGSKKFVYADGRLATTLSLFGEYLQGGRYSYTYSGDLNNDGSGLNDLLYIPTESEINAMNFTGNGSSQKTALNDFIKNDAYLSANRGQYAEKYAALAPWYSNIDLRILQDIAISGDNKIQLSADILNIGNLLNSNWGVRQWAGQTGLSQPIAVSVADGTPTYSFDESQTSAIQTRFDLSSRWRMQFGVRYSF